MIDDFLVCVVKLVLIWIVVNLRKYEINVVIEWIRRLSWGFVIWEEVGWCMMWIIKVEFG